MENQKHVIIFYGDVLRNLKNSDWTQLPDNDLNDEKKEKWKLYRKELRKLAKICKQYIENNIMKAELSMPKIPDNERKQDFINLLNKTSSQI